VGASGEDLDRARRFVFGTLGLVGARTTPIRQGLVVRHDGLPQVWSLNQVRVTEPTDYAGVLTLVEEHLGDLSYRHLVVEHEPTGRQLEQLLAADGWEVEREVLMTLGRLSDRAIDTGGVVEAGEDDALELMTRWMDEDPNLDESEEGLEQVREFNRSTWRARSAHRLGANDKTGALGAITMLFSDGEVAQVEDVYVVPGLRRQGIGRALVTRAVSIARERDHELIFIVADDNDWPKQLYAQVGFEPAGYSWLFHRKLAA
jgi:GNAT superfamily N-acetyltransferase